MNVIAQQGDTLDLVCWRYYQRSDGGIVEAVLKRNPALAEFGAILPYGTLINLPDLPPVSDKKMVQLWD